MGELEDFLEANYVHDTPDAPEVLAQIRAELDSNVDAQPKVKLENILKILEDRLAE